MKWIRWTAIWLAVGALSSGCASPLLVEGEIDAEAFGRIISTTSAARGIDLRGSVVAKAVSRETLADVLQQTIRSEWSRADLRDYQDSHRVMGLWPAEVEMESSYIDQVARHITGVYIPIHRIIYVVDEQSNGWRPRFGFLFDEREFILESIMAHEVVHALQHQQYPDLVEMRNLFEAQDDVASAVQAALEGDALYFGTLAMAPGIESAGLYPGEEALNYPDESLLLSSSALDAASAPAIIRKSLIFPYAAGFRLAVAEKHRLLERPPISTEQVLHPEKRHESFLMIEMRPVIEAFPTDCRALHENSVGELSISILLRDFEAESTPEAWWGWDGDRYAAAACDGGREFIWITQWDSESDAQEFQRAYRSIADKVAARSGDSALPVTARNGAQVVITSERFSKLAEHWPKLARYSRVANLSDLRDITGITDVSDASPSARAPLTSAKRGFLPLLR